MISRSFVALASLVAVCSLARADQYQDAISKAFPGFQILSPSEFTPDVQKQAKGNPGLVTGRFRNDEMEDFAALIRENIKRPGTPGKDYYLGMFVVCYVKGEQRYACQKLGQALYGLPLESYVYRKGPGFSCPNHDGKKGRVTAKHDSLGAASFAPGVGTYAESVYIFMPNGTYFDCSGD